MSRQNCYNNPDTWNRYTISKVIKKNPALGEALKLLGIKPEELAAKAMNAYERKENLRRENQKLIACAMPNGRVNPGMRVPANIAKPTGAKGTGFAQLRDSAPQTPQDGRDQNLVIEKPAANHKGEAKIHVGYADEELEPKQFSVLADNPANTFNVTGTEPPAKFVTEKLVGEDLPVHKEPYKLNYEAPIAEYELPKVDGIICTSEEEFKAAMSLKIQTHFTGWKAEQVEELMNNLDDSELTLHRIAELESDAVKDVLNEAAAALDRGEGRSAKEFFEERRQLRNPTKKD